jgi:hypothetical protein
MSKPPKKLTGRPTTDDRGNSIWKWTGESDVESVRVRALAEGLSLEAPSPEESLDPYNQLTPDGTGTTKGRSLDDMRRLNEEMKREHEQLVKRLRKRTPKK